MCNTKTNTEIIVLKGEEKLPLEYRSNTIQRLVLESMVLYNCVYGDDICNINKSELDADVMAYVGALPSVVSRMTHYSFSQDEVALVITEMDEIFKRLIGLRFCKTANILVSDLDFGVIVKRMTSLDDTMVIDNYEYAQMSDNMDNNCPMGEFINIIDELVNEFMNAYYMSRTVKKCKDCTVCQECTTKVNCADCGVCTECESNYANTEEDDNFDCNCECSSDYDRGMAYKLNCMADCGEDVLKSIIELDFENDDEEKILDVLCNSPIGVITLYTIDNELGREEELRNAVLEFGGKSITISGEIIKKAIVKLKAESEESINENKNEADEEITKSTEEKPVEKEYNNTIHNDDSSSKKEYKKDTSATKFVLGKLKSSKKAVVVVAYPNDGKYEADKFMQYLSTESIRKDGVCVYTDFDIFESIDKFRNASPEHKEHNLSSIRKGTVRFISGLPKDILVAGEEKEDLDKLLRGVTIEDGTEVILVYLDENGSAEEIITIVY